MHVSDKIIRYLKETYQPEAIIVYGSFADGSANENSDFDALVIADCEKTHDASVIEGIVLDVFVYPVDMFLSAYDPEEFVQIWDGNIVTDKNGIAGLLQKRVLNHLERAPRKSRDEILREIGWCEKMVCRTARNDAEGHYRWHWVLVDSLEIYCDVRGERYYGPKKTLRCMEQTDAVAFRKYTEALKEFKRESLMEWISYLRQISSVL